MKTDFDFSNRESILSSRQERQFHDTKFSFLNDHAGLRRCAKHLIIGTSGSGKTSLTRGVLADLIRNTKVMLYSTEESMEDTVAALHRMKLSEHDVKNLSFLQERDVLAAVGRDPSKAYEAAKIIGAAMLNAGAQILLFDNITTSDFYDGMKIEQAKDFVTEISEMIRMVRVPAVIVAHTSAGVRDDQQALIDPADIRGPKTLSNRAEFLYVYQKFNTVDEKGNFKSFGTIRVRKARGYPESMEKIYFLEFDSQTASYTHDKSVEFKAFNEVYEKRARLGKK